jgi:hypothetical protein
MPYVDRALAFKIYADLIIAERAWTVETFRRTAVYRTLAQHAIEAAAQFEYTETELDETASEGDDDAT